MSAAWFTLRTKKSRVIPVSKFQCRNERDVAVLQIKTLSTHFFNIHKLCKVRVESINGLNTIPTGRTEKVTGNRLKITVTQYNSLGNSDKRNIVIEYQTTVLTQVAAAVLRSRWASSRRRSHSSRMRSRFSCVVYAESVKSCVVSTTVSVELLIFDSTL